MHGYQYDSRQQDLVDHYAVARVYGCGPRNAYKMKSERSAKYEALQIGAFVMENGISVDELRVLVESYLELQKCRKR